MYDSYDPDVEVEDDAEDEVEVDEDNESDEPELDEEPLEPLDYPDEGSY